VFHRRIAARAYLRACNLRLGQSIGAESSTLGVISRGVVNAWPSLGDRHRHHLLILPRLGFRRAVLPLRHQDRYEGRSSDTLGKLIEVAVNGTFFQTTRLLRWFAIAGFVLAAVGLVLASVCIALYLTANSLPAFTGPAVLTLLVEGFIIVSTGFIGLYVGKIFEQVKGRPLYVVARRTRPAETVSQLESTRDKSST
jgi:dolichol-phosphate mannosyltransferase